MTDATPARHSRRGLIVPFAVVLVALAAWTGWWFYLVTQIEQRLDAQVARLEAQGWQVKHARVTTTGWPFRARVAVPHPDIVAPSGLGVAAPELVAEANAYNPTKWVVVAPDGLTLTRGAKGKVALRGDALRMSVHGLTQAWPNVAVELVNPVFTPLKGAEPFPIGRAGRIEFYLRPHIVGSSAPTDSVDVLFRLIDAHGREAGPVQAITRDGVLTIQMEGVVEKASLLRGSDAAGIFSAWIRGGGAFTRVRGELAAGDSRATVASDRLSADADGRIEGVVTLQAQKPLAAIAGLAGTRSGAVDRVGAGAAALATGAAGASDDAVDLSLVFRDGRTYLGPFTLAPAPKLF